MGKHEVGTPKYIANKIKSKGLQKLRWYCQMCEKQCRDENGFKCHTMSESHHRQLLLFADNPHKYMDQFSREFSDGFLNLVKRQFGTRRVPANRVYQDYIADRGHIHMNATQWLSLTGFVKWLGRTGKCVVDETEKGWFLTYIDRDPETLAAQEKKVKKEKMDKDDQERMMDFIERQVEKGKKDNDRTEDTAVPLMRAEEDGPLVLPIKLKPKAVVTMAPPLAFAPKKLEKSDSKAKRKIKEEPLDDDEKPKKVKKESSQETGWLRPNLVVKIITKTLGSKYYKAKGVVQDPVMESGFVGKVKIISPPEVEGHVVKLDEVHLETVIPAIGREVLVFKGDKRGRAIMKKVRIEEFCADVEFDDGFVLKRIPYESICKFVD